MAKLPDYDMVAAYRHVTMHVTVRRMPEARARFWVAIRLVRLAAWIANVGGLEFHHAYPRKDAE